MAGTVLENLSGRKLAVLTSTLLIAQLACFLIGGLIAPAPSSAPTVLATKCYDYEGNRSRWLWPRGQGSCHQLSDLSTPQLTEKNVVFAFQIPLAKEGVILDFSRWQQSLVGILQLEIAYEKGRNVPMDSPLLLDSRLGYRNRWEPEGHWTLIAESEEERTLNCVSDGDIEGHNLDCGLLPLFELGSLHHDFYLLNIRLPIRSGSPYNRNIGKLTDLHLVTIHQNGGFTKVWFSLKTAFTPILLAVTVWFWRRVKAQPRPPALLEKTIFALALAILALDLPVEWFTLFLDMPYMLLLSDIRQGIFYAALLSFWLVFTGEHLMESGREKKGIQNYRNELGGVAVGVVALFLFDLCERGTHLRNPFHSLWATTAGARVGLSLLVAAATCASLYFVLLSYLVWRVFTNIGAKQTVLPAMSEVRRLHYRGIIHRFKFLLMATLVCAALTVAGFIFGQVTEDKWKWEGDVELEYTSAFFTGVYGMWNIYTAALLCLYAPSHKSWPQERDPFHPSSGAEEIEFSRLDPDTSEISAIASFAKKVAAD